MKSFLPHWMKFALLCVATQCVACASVSEGEQGATLKRVLGPEQIPESEAAETPETQAEVEEEQEAETSATVASPPPQIPTLTPTPLAAVPAPALTPTPSLPSAAGASTESRAQPAPNLQQPARMVLPLPRGVAHADLLHFVNAHADVIAAYQPLAEDWKLYARVFMSGSVASVDEISALRVRVRENLARSHWLFVWGTYQASAALLSQNQTSPLIMDRQQDFVQRMNVLVFLMTEMQNAGMNTNHRGYLRDFYKYINVKHFKRSLRDRPAKPVGPLKPY